MFSKISNTHNNYLIASYLFLDSFDMTSQQVCLLCLRVVDDTTAKSRQKIKIKTLCQLITTCHQNYKISEHGFDADEMCDFCTDCYPILRTLEEIRKQISLLEEEIEEKSRHNFARFLPCTKQVVR